MSRELVVFGKTAQVNPIGWMLDHAPFLGARRIQERNLLKSLVERVKRDIDGYGFKYEEYLHALSDDIPPKTTREMPLYLMSGIAQYNVTLVVIRESEDMLDLKIYDTSRQIHLSGGRIPNYQTDLGYLEWSNVCLPKDSISFMKELLDAEVDHQKLQLDFTQRLGRLGDPQRHSLYWNSNNIKKLPNPEELAISS